MRLCLSAACWRRIPDGMKKKLKWLALGGVAVFAILQVFNPPRTNPPVQNDFATAAKPPPEVASSLRAACYDCHSDETIWPLYSRIAPVSWLVASDVNEGRHHLNFSAWPTEQSAAAKDLDRINEVIDYREMPPAKYTLIHAEARLNDKQRKAILDWTSAAADALRGTTNN
jgi:hypothetical protein